MSVWDYLDKHEIIGSFVVLSLAFIAMLAIDAVTVNLAKAWAARAVAKATQHKSVEQKEK